MNNVVLMNDLHFSEPGITSKTWCRLTSWFPRTRSASWARSRRFTSCSCTRWKRPPSSWWKTSPSSDKSVKFRFVYFQSIKMFYWFRNINNFIFKLCLMLNYIFTHLYRRLNWTDWILFRNDRIHRQTLWAQLQTRNSKSVKVKSWKLVQINHFLQIVLFVLIVLFFQTFNCGCSNHKMHINLCKKIT